MAIRWRNGRTLTATLWTKRLWEIWLHRDCCEDIAVHIAFLSFFCFCRVLGVVNKTNNPSRPIRRLIETKDMQCKQLSSDRGVCLSLTTQSSLTAFFVFVVTPDHSLVLSWPCNRRKAPRSEVTHIPLDLFPLLTRFRTPWSWANPSKSLDSKWMCKAPFDSLLHILPTSLLSIATAILDGRVAALIQLIGSTRFTSYRSLVMCILKSGSRHKSMVFVPTQHLSIYRECMGFERWDLWDASRARNFWGG